jgi:hypothetical protein
MLSLPHQQTTASHLTTSSVPAAQPTPAKIKRSRLSIVGSSPKKAKKDESLQFLQCFVCQLPGSVQNVVR